MKTPLLRVTTLALGLVSAASLTRAGVVMQFEQKEARSTPRTGSIWIEPDRLRVDTGEGASVIFRGDKSLLWVLQPAEGSYLEITQADAERMAGQMSQAMEQMNEQLRQMPPEQRAMVEKMMKNRMGGAEPAKKAPPEIVKTSRQETVNGYPCTVYEVRNGAQLSQQLWVTDFGRFKLAARDFAVFESMRKFMETLTGPLAKQMNVGFVQSLSDEDRPGAIPGVPVRIVTGDTTQEMKSIAHEDVAPSRFEVPAGLKKQELAAPPHK